MRTLVWISALAMLVACGEKKKDAEPTKESAPEVNAELAGVMVTTPLGKGVSVADARAKKTADEILVVGRINKIVKGYAAFNVTDLKLAYCGEKEAEDCPTPWDYCCTAGDEQLANRISVAVYGENGEPIRAANLGDLRELDVVTIKGKLETDEHGNILLRATAIHRDSRPDVPDHVRWP